MSTVAILLPVALAMIAVVGLIRSYLRTQRTRRALLGAFVDASSDAQDADAIGIEATWVALRLAGFSPDTRVHALPPEAQARVRATTEEVIAAGEQLVRDGVLRHLPISFEHLGERRRVNAPRSLFLLTPRGAALVMSRRVTHAQAA